MRLVKKSLPRVEPLEDRCLPSADFVLQWNNELLSVQQQRGQGNQAAARALAMLGAAVYDSVNAINPTHTVYQVDARAAFPGASTASADAAAAQAAHDIALALYPSTNPEEPDPYKTRLDNQLAEVPDGQPKTDGILLGQYVAAKVLTWRSTDGSSDRVRYDPGTGPGVWQPTPRPNPNPPPEELPGLPAATPQWPKVIPFALTSGDQFRPGPPPALTDADYTEAYREVKALGGNGTTTPSTRTPEQTEIGLFWAGLGVSNSGVAIWTQITQTVATEHHLSLADTARLYAQVNVASADAFIASFDAKYEYNYWRPVTAIRAADTDGNPDTVADSTWTPLITTPNHPSYTSNHSTHSRAAAEALAAFFGTDQVRFTATAEVPGVGEVERSFNKFTDAAKEAGKSRIYVGIHWSFDCAAGESLGRKIGQYVAANFFLPVTDSGGGAPGSGGGHGKGPGAAAEASPTAEGGQQEVGRKAGGVQQGPARKAGPEQEDGLGLGDASGFSRILVLPPRVGTTPGTPSTSPGVSPAGGQGEPTLSALLPVLPSGAGDMSAPSAKPSPAAADALFVDLARGLSTDDFVPALTGDD
jgi:PAP2 superfamily